MNTMNRLHNVTNPYQGRAKKVLCVCSAGLLRSPTLANILHRDYGYNTRAVGADAEYALIPADQVLIEWADEVVCVSPEVHETLKQIVDLNSSRVVVLNIPDRFAYMADALEHIMLKQYIDVSIMERAQL